MGLPRTLYFVIAGTVLSCGPQNLNNASRVHAVSYPDTDEGYAQRRDIIDRATVDGNSMPRSLHELVAGPETLKICQTLSGEHVTCQPKLIGSDSLGRPIIRFPELRCDLIRPGDRDFKIPSGKTEKFYCRAKDEQGKSHTVKVKYKSQETYTEVAVTRLLWTFGFAADTVQPVSVVCRGCPEDPFPMLSAPDGGLDWPSRDMETRFTFAAVEEKHPGEKINIENAEGVEVLEGFTYPELMRNLSGNPHLTEDEKDRREALAFLNAFFYNLDVKSENQRLVCIAEENGVCLKGLAITQDVGFTFGSSPVRSQKLDLKGWRDLAVWKHLGRCDASQHTRVGGIDIGVSIGMSESGRREVERLFGRLNSDWLRHVFETARFGEAGFSFPKASVDWAKATANQNVLAWVEAFEHRVRAFRQVAQCPVERR